MRKEIVIPDIDKINERVMHSKEKALRISIFEGSAASVAEGAGGSYITPFALALSATNFQVGLLSAFSGLLAPIAQFYGSNLMERYSRKRIVIAFVLLQALMWLPIAALSYFLWKGIFISYLPYALIVFYTILAIFGGIAHPAWFSWMGDLVPENERGRYFGKRNRITGIVSLVAFLTVGYFIDIFKTKGLVLLGFAIIFALSFTFRIFSFGLFHKQYCPKFKLEKGYYFSLWQFLRRYDNFGKFAVFQFAFNFAVMIASPFFAVYLLKDLGFNYLTFTIVSVSSSMFYLIFVPLAGKFSDKYGNRELLYVGSFLFVLTPLLIIFFKTPLTIILIPYLVSGLGNAAFTIATNNFTYDAVNAQHRGLCVAYTNILAGIGVFLGSLLGGYIASLDFGVKSAIVPVFIAAAFFRLLMVLVFVPGIKEVRKVQRSPHFSLSLVHPFKMINADVGWFKNFFRG